MARFLFATWEGGGHVQPMLLVAQGLKALGHEMLAISDACNAPDAAALGVPFRPWRRAPSRAAATPETDPVQDWLASSPLDVIHRVLTGVLGGPAALYGADTREAIADLRPDVVVCQELLFGVMAAAEAARLPLAVLSSNIWSLPTVDTAPPFGAGAPPAANEGQRDFYRRVASHARAAFQEGLPALNEARGSLGLTPLAELFDQLRAAARILIATSRAFDFDQTPPDPFRYVGPYMADPAWTEPWSPPFEANDHRPLALVSFSTMYQGQEAILRRVIEALAGLPLRAILTLGPALGPEDFAAPDNVAVASRAPFGALLPLASAVVTHAGHATTLRSLMAGVPLLCLPQGRDQFDNAARVVESGAGLRLPPDAPAADIAAALQRLLSEPGFAQAAAALGRRISADAAARSAEAELLALARSA